MNITKSLMGLALLFSVVDAHAHQRPPPCVKPPVFNGGTLSCVNTKINNSPTIWSYVVKTTKSLRLGSDVLYNDGTNVNIISSLNVAQYDADKNSLYMLIDDINENPTMLFVADKALCGQVATFNGTLQTLSTTTGKVTTTKYVKCTVAQ